MKSELGGSWKSLGGNRSRILHHLIVIVFGLSEVFTCGILNYGINGSYVLVGQADFFIAVQVSDPSVPQGKHNDV